VPRPVIDRATARERPLLVARAQCKLGTSTRARVQARSGHVRATRPAEMKGDSMKAVRLLVVTLVLYGCSERALTTAPQSAPPPPQGSLLGNLLGATGLLQCSNLPYASATKTIGYAGGTINVGPHTLTVPAGALVAPVAITGQLVTGYGVNAVRFGPAGLRFQRSAYLTMSYANCNLLGLLLPKQVAYVGDNLNILSYLLSFDNLFASKVTGQVNHFSNYAVAW
jgi:hypothetical protein